MFLAGVSLTIGPQATLRFFMRRKNLKARALQPAGLVATFPGLARQSRIVFLLNGFLLHLIVLTGRMYIRCFSCECQQLPLPERR